LTGIDICSIADIIAVAYCILLTFTFIEKILSIIVKINSSGFLPTAGKEAVID